MPLSPPGQENNSTQGLCPYLLYCLGMLSYPLGFIAVKALGWTLNHLANVNSHGPAKRVIFAKGTNEPWIWVGRGIVRWWAAVSQLISTTACKDLCSQVCRFRTMLLKSFWNEYNEFSFTRVQLMKAMVFLNQYGWCRFQLDTKKHVQNNAVTHHGDAYYFVQCSVFTVYLMRKQRHEVPLNVVETWIPFDKL